MDNEPMCKMIGDFAAQHDPRHLVVDHESAPALALATGNHASLVHSKAHRPAFVVKEAIVSEGIMDVHVGSPPSRPREAELPVIQEWRCPACQSEPSKHAGHVIAGNGMITSQHWCDSCGIAFWFARKTISGSLPG